MTRDPYRYYRIEAQELLEGLAQSLLALERGADREQVKVLLRLAHTLKGASRVVRRGDIGDLAHAMEDLISPYRASGGPVPAPAIDAALALLDHIREHVAGLAPGIAQTTRAANPAKASEAIDERAPGSGLEHDQQAIRIPVRELDAVMDSALEAHAAASSIRRQGEDLEQLGRRARELLSDLHACRTAGVPARVMGAMEHLVQDLDTAKRNSIATIDRVHAELNELRSAASDLRLVSAHSLIRDLERVARDAARELSKEVELNASGVDTHIDAHVLAGLRGALGHIVRNSVAHGIEEEPARIRAGKPAKGRIEIAIERRGHRISVTCRDDGRGVDLEAVRRVASERGLVSAASAQALDDNALGQLLMRGGVSTSSVVSGISGRGVGLEAAHHAVESLKGEIHLHSVLAKGTVVEILVPLSLSSLRTLALEVAGNTVLLPLNCVRQTLRVESKEIFEDASSEFLAVDGSVLSFVALERALELPASARGPMQSAVVIEAEGALAVLGVDRLGVARDVAVRAIPGHAATKEVVSGAAFDNAGCPLLMLSPSALVRLASSALAMPEASPPSRRPVLVVDDSLTTRMLEQSILESAGYEVDLAASGEEGLLMAKHRRYGVFLVDVEMPGMNGFEFIATTRNDAELKDIPCILVTSLADAEHKERGLQLGVQAYIVKSEFDQDLLLGTIGRLVG